jgi:uncharacterized protein GlcG (DUF336 family)
MSRIPTGICIAVMCALLLCGESAAARPRGDDPGEPPPETTAPAPVPAPGPTLIACAGPALCALEAGNIAAAAAAAVANTGMTAAVVDRLGNILALYRQPGAAPGNDDLAVGVARTAAFFSHDQAPLSSRTVRFISGIHFPPGIARTPSAALYGIENTNRGCGLNAPLNGGALLAEGRSVAGVLGNLPCRALDTTGCGLGIVTGKADLFDSDPRAVNPGGVPIYRQGGADSGRLLGGIGVAGVPAAAAEFAAFSAAFAGPATAPVPRFPLPAPGNVFIDGVRLPFVQQVNRPGGTSPGTATGSFAIGPADGVPAPAGYLVGPHAGALLSAVQVDRIVRQAETAAGRARAQIRLPLGSRTRMAIAVADLDGTLLALYRMPDTTVFSTDVAATKARNVVYFSSSPAALLDLVDVPAGTAVTNRTIGFGAQPLYPPGIDGTSPGPFFDLFLNDSANPCSQGHQAPYANQSGVVFFPGSLPLYNGNTLVGGLGVSGDGVEQDDYVSLLGGAGLLPPEGKWANRVFVRGVRLPFLKLPRNPEG